MRPRFSAPSCPSHARPHREPTTQPALPCVARVCATNADDVVAWAQEGGGGHLHREVASSMLAGAVVVMSPAFTDALPAALRPVRHTPRRAAGAGADAGAGAGAVAAVEHVRMTPDILTGLLVAGFLIAVLLVAMQCLLSVQGPSKFVHAAMPPGKDF